MKTRTRIVVLPGRVGALDYASVRDPALLMDMAGVHVRLDGDLVMFYSGGGSGRYSIFAARSEDGRFWRKHGCVLRLARKHNEYASISMGSAIMTAGDEIRLYVSLRYPYQKERFAIGLVTVDAQLKSQDMAYPVIAPAAFRKCWDVFLPSVAFSELDAMWLMLVEGRTGRAFAIFGATSADGIDEWRPMNQGKPIFKPRWFGRGSWSGWESRSVANPKLSVVPIARGGVTYRMIYNGAGPRRNGYEIATAASDDLIHWCRHGRILRRGLNGTWNGGRIEGGVHIDAARMLFFGGPNDRDGHPFNIGLANVGGGA